MLMEVALYYYLIRFFKKRKEKRSLGGKTSKVAYILQVVVFPFTNNENKNSKYTGTKV